MTEQENIPLLFQETGDKKPKISSANDYCTDDAGRFVTSHEIKSKKSSFFQKKPTGLADGFDCVIHTDSCCEQTVQLRRTAGCGYPYLRR